MRRDMIALVTEGIFWYMFAFVLILAGVGA